MSETTVTTPNELEIRVERIFDAPRAHVFSVWTDPKLIPEWWGDGTVVEEMDVRPGGTYRFRTDFGIVEGEFREVAAPERLVQTFQNHLQTLEFEDLGDQTKLTQTMIRHDRGARHDDAVRRRGRSEERLRARGRAAAAATARRVSRPRKPMRLWRLTRTGQTALDGAATSKHGGRYSPPGVPVVNFASEAGLAVLVALRYVRADPADAPDDYVLGWTEIDAIPERVRAADGDDAIRKWVTGWLEERRSLLAAVRSQVLPEADVVLMNPLHFDAARVRPLATRPFSFAECLHTPPMLARYSGERRAPT